MNTETTTDRPLDGCKVLDLTSIVLGPLTTLILADMGAEVIKVEAPEGDAIRYAGTVKHAGMGPIYLALNRNKKSLAIDLKRPDAKKILHRLACWADVVVHNMRPSAAVRLGIDYPTLREINPRIVYCAASGFAEGSERADDPAVDDVIQAGSGIASLFAENDADPRYVPGLIADKVCGLLACQAILGALLAREKSGLGQAVNVPMFEAISAFTLVEQLGGATFSPEGSPGYGRLKTPHRRPMQTKDGFVAITPYSKRHWQSFFAAAGREDLCHDPRITDPKRRNAEIADLYALLSGILLDRTTEEWMTIARKAGIPASPVNSLDSLISSQALRDQEYLISIDHPSEGKILGIGPLVRFEGMTCLDVQPAPRLGENGSHILREMQFSNETIAKWRSEGLLIEPIPA
jgi:formyl-CoA transferase